MATGRNSSSRPPAWASPSAVTSTCRTASSITPTRPSAPATRWVAPVRKAVTTSCTTLTLPHGSTADRRAADLAGQPYPLAGPGHFHDRHARIAGGGGTSDTRGTAVVRRRGDRKSVV